MSSKHLPASLPPDTCYISIAAIESRLSAYTVPAKVSQLWTSFSRNPWETSFTFLQGSLDPCNLCEEPNIYTKPEASAHFSPKQVENPLLHCRCAKIAHSFLEACCIFVGVPGYPSTKRWCKFVQLQLTIILNIPWLSDACWLTSQSLCHEFPIIHLQQFPVFTLSRPTTMLSQQANQHLATTHDKKRINKAFNIAPTSTSLHFFLLSNTWCVCVYV